MASGYRPSDSGGLYNVGTCGYAWSSSPYSASSVYGSGLTFHSSSVNPEGYNNRALGYPVRCVQLRNQGPHRLKPKKTNQQPIISSIMKRHLFLWTALSIASLTLTSVNAQMRFVDGASLTLIGKAQPTPHIYHRIDTTAYKGFVGFENQQVRCAAGLALLFTTDSPRLDIRTQYLFEHRSDDTPCISTGGYDLYIRQNGEWLYAASHVSYHRGEPFTLIDHMDTSTKECLLYLPNYSELGKVEIGIAENAHIEPLENPFRHKIVVFGSSYTHGVCTSRPGMSYPLIIQRDLGLDICSIALSGNCLLQPYFAAYLADCTDADAMLFDAFSNPLDYMIEERLLPFIERIRQGCPDVPLIFVQTIYRESGNFDLHAREVEANKRAAARRMMAEAMKRFDKVYFIDCDDLTGDDHTTSVDGIHPSDLGYWRWAKRLEPELRKILRRNGIRL